MKRTSPPLSLSLNVYSVDRKVLNQIQMVQLKASFGSKIDNLTRHLLVRTLLAISYATQWIKSHGDEKAVVFSQWSDGRLSLEHNY